MLGQELDRLGRRLEGQEMVSCALEALELLQVRQSNEILLLKGPIIEGALVASRARWELFSSESRIGSEAALAMCSEKFCCISRGQLLHAEVLIST